MPLSPDHSTSVPAQTPAKKRVRLSRACNVCRSRKVRCDEQQPSCSRCVAAGIDCITTDPRSSASLSSSNRKRAGDYRASPTSNGPQQTAVGQPVVHGDIRQSAPNTGMHGVYDSHGANQNVNHQHESLRTPSSLSGSMIMNDSSHSSGLPGHAIHENAAEGRTEEEADSPEFAFNSAGHLEHKYMGASSLQVFTQWLEMTFRVESLDLTGRFRYGLRHCEEMDIPDFVEMPSLPNAWRTFCRAYVQDIAPLFPVAREGEIFQIADLLMVRRASDLPQRDRPRLALLYACLSLGARQAQPTGDESGSYLRAACSLYAYVAAYPYLESAQALLMLSLALRAHSRDGAASQALGLAIRILQSIGLHRQASSQPMQAQDHQASTSLSRPVQRHAQSFHHSQEIWWAAYCLERISSLESGRPSSISDEDVDQVPEFDQLQAPYQAYLISLTKIQGDVNRQLFSNHTKHTFTSPRDIFYIQSRLDRQLYSWYSDLPQRFKLDGELLTFEPRTVAARAFLLMQYHSTLATVHRSALLMDQQIHIANLRAANLPQDKLDRLLESKGICISSAREIARLFLQVLERTSNTALLSMTQPLMAVYILAIKNLRDSASWMARADLSLLHSATEAIERRYKLDGQDPGFYYMLKILQQFATIRESGNAQSTSLQSTQPAIDQSATDHTPSYDPMSEWNSLFPRLFLGDMAQDDAGRYQDEMFGLMDIPQLTEEEIMNLALPHDLDYSGHG